MAGLTRRTFLGGAVTILCTTPLGCEPAEDEPPAELPEPTPTGSRIDGFWVPAGTTLAPQDFARLSALFDALIPGDPDRPGAVALQAPWYLDQLLGAFTVDPPRIFAGGPYSGRHGGLDGFSTFQRLTRVEELRWRIYLEGSRGLPEREFAGPVKGLQERYLEGLNALDAAAGARFATLPLDARTALLQGADPDFVALAYEHANEGSYGDPVYGGNALGRGWEAIVFEGDRQPLGYTGRQMERPEEG